MRLQLRTVVQKSGNRCGTRRVGNKAVARWWYRNPAKGSVGAGRCEVGRRCGAAKGAAGGKAAAPAVYRTTSFQVIAGECSVAEPLSMQVGRSDTNAACEAQRSSGGRC